MNPFATRFTRPGALAYFMPAGITLDSLVERLAVNGWRGEIIGPHGSGKSTLLASLAPLVAARGRRVVSFTLHRGQRALPRAWRAAVADRASDEKSRPAQLVIDGYEQLSLWSRWRIRAYCERRGVGLLITAHRPMGLPPLFETQPDLQTVQEVAAKLLAAQPSPPAPLIAPDDVAAAFEKHRGNVRETLFALYDLAEKRTRSK